jgi:hypothetical protein
MTCVPHLAAQDALQLECFCEMAQSIKASSTGTKLKDVILARGYPQKALAYIAAHMPQQVWFPSHQLLHCMHILRVVFKILLLPV